MAEDAQRIRIALVDDQELNRVVLERFLSSEIHAVDFVHGGDGEDAVAMRLREPRLRLMLINGEMPGMDGPAAIREIRRLEAERRLPRVPIAITSGEQDLLGAGLLAGADEAIELPVAPGDVVAVAYRLFARWSSPRGPRPRVVAVVDDDPAVRSLIRRLVEKLASGTVVVLGADGRDALALRQANPPPDVMLINWLMGDADGAQAIARIREVEAAQRLPRCRLILTSGDPAVAEKAVAVDADDALAHPFTVVQLARAIGLATLRGSPVKAHRPVQPAERPARRRGVLDPARNACEVPPTQPLPRHGT